jgi:C4-dicarboxylate transporter DctQ subunit
MAWLQSFGRSAFKAINSIKLTWAQEACIYLFVWMAKFGAAYGVRQGIHVGVDILVERLEGNTRKLITVIAMSGGILFTAIISWIGTDFVYHVYHGGQTSPDLEIKMWLIYLAVPLGSALMCFRFIQALYLYLTTGYIAHHDHGAVDGLEDEADDLAKGGHA